jgi:S-phase kinase-associated protein 1
MKLLSDDGQLFELGYGAAMLSGTLRNMAEDLGWRPEGGHGPAEPVPVPGVRGAALARVAEFCRARAEAQPIAAGEAEGKAQGKGGPPFVAPGMPQSELKELTLAANFLDVPELLDDCCRALAEAVSGMDPDGIREYFGIENDFGPGEEEALRRETRWTFD